MNRPERNHLTTEFQPIAKPAPWGRLSMSSELRLSTICSSQFSALVLERGLAHVADTRWATEQDSIDPVLPHALTSSRSPHVRGAVLDAAPFGEDALALVLLRDGMAYASFAAQELASLEGMERWLRELVPPVAESVRQEVLVSFWTCGQHGPQEYPRTIAVPRWKEVAGNYPAEVRAQLVRLVDPSFRPAEGGQLVLWHGPPGTGKTYALRALAWEWRSWCRTHYIVDPEVFFGSRADYLLDVIFDEEDEDDRERWRLIVLEDTGELLAADARERTGQGLSRLLNLVDGIVGQGLRVLVLVTTNEPLQRLHPAVARPGRCAANIEFGAFPADEAAAWLHERGCPSNGSSTEPLATLFARLGGAAPPRARPIGFRPSA